MTNIDIRYISDQPVVQIQFADRGQQQIAGIGGRAVGAWILKRPNLDQNFLQIKDTHDFVNICSVEHARNLIKALEKAIELEWLK